MRRQVHEPLPYVEKDDVPEAAHTFRLQAQSAAAAAENSALDAAKYARMSHCIKALSAAQAAAQSFNLVCLCSLAFHVQLCTITRVLSPSMRPWTRL